MATSISAIGGVSYGGYPGPLISATNSASEDTYGSLYGNAADATETSGLAGTQAADSLTVPLNPYDLDGDGVVTPQEYQEAIAEQEAATANLPTTTFAALTGTQDADGDGILDINDLDSGSPFENFTTRLETPINNGGFFGDSFGPFDASSNSFQNSVLGNLAAQTYGAVSSAGIDQAPRQQSLSLLA